MDLTKLQDAVFIVLRDSERIFVTTDGVDVWLNEAYLDLVARTGVLKKSTSGTTTSTGTVPLPTDFISLAQFYVDTTTVGVSTSPEFVRDDIFLSWKLSGGTTNRTMARIFGANIETFPIVGSKDYTLEYVYKPPPLVNGTDTPLLPEELHVKLVNYARSHAKLQEGEQTEAESYMSLYLDGLPPTAPDALGREHPGQLNLIPAPTYWDTDAG